MSETCSPCAFHPLSLPGVQITALEAHLVENYTRTARAELYYGHPTVTVENATFCNITIGYTQPGGQDTIHVETWLPVDDYNGRLQSIGGGGWVAGRYPPAYTAMAGALSEGYATSTTDAGLLQAPDFSPDLWALDDEGGPNYQALRNLAYVSLNDQVSPPRLPNVLSFPLTSSFVLGNPGKITYRGLSWPISRVLVLERLLAGWSPRHDACAALPRRV